MKNIFVPIDFSIASHNAAEYAVSLAQPFGAAVYILNAVAPPLLLDDSMFASIMITQAEIVAENDKLLKQEIKTLSKDSSVRIKGMVKEGYASEMIPKLANELDADLFVMGMKGKGMSNSIFGSTTTGVIRKSTHPVLAIPENVVYQPINNITLASDFDVEIKMDRYIVLQTLAEKFDSQINILNVQKGSGSLTQEEAIGKMNTSLAFSKHNFQFHTINENKVEEGINKFLEQNHSDVLAMVAHSHPLFERMFGKVHTKSMSYQTKIPLLVLQNK